MSDPLIVALDEVTDPQNLGAIARTAEAVGATGIVIPERRARRSRRRSARRRPARSSTCRSRRSATSPTSSSRRRSSGCWVYGAAAGGRTRYDQPDYTGGVVAVLGAEGKGLRQRVASMCDDLVSLPLQGQASNRSTCRRPPRSFCTEILQQRLDAST